MDRRDFLKKTVLAATALAAGRLLPRGSDAGALAADVSTNTPALPRREYGKTGIRLSIVGLGGIVVSGAAQAHANRVVAEAVERGVNYFDVAPPHTVTRRSSSARLSSPIARTSSWRARRSSGTARAPLPN